MPFKEMEVRAADVKVGDHFMFIHDWFVVRKVEEWRAGQTRITLDRRDRDHTFFFNSHIKRTIRREVSLPKCHPCFDSDCDCVYDQVMP